MAYDQVHVPLFSSLRFTNTSKRGAFGDALQEMDDSVGRVNIFHEISPFILDYGKFETTWN